MDQQRVLCHRQYYQKQLPRLYHGALYLLGERTAAQEVAGQVWQAACAAGNPADEGAFVRSSMRMLISACKRRAVTYQVEEILPAPSLPNLWLLQSLGAQTFSDRVLLVLWAALGMDIKEIAAVVLWPGWAVKRRLGKLTGQLCTLKNVREHVFC